MAGRTGMVVCAAVGWLSLGIGPVLATGSTFQWQYNVNGDFGVGSNWVGGVVPGAADSVSFDGVGVSTVWLSSDVVNQRLSQRSYSQVSLYGSPLPAAYSLYSYALQDGFVQEGGAALWIGNSSSAVDLEIGGALTGNGGTIGVKQGSRLSASSLQLTSGNSGSSSIMVGDGGGITGRTSALTVSGDLQLVNNSGSSNFTQLELMCGSTGDVGGQVGVGASGYNSSQIAVTGGSTMSSGSLSIGTSGQSTGISQVFLLNSTWVQRGAASLALGNGSSSQGILVLDNASRFNGGSGAVAVQSGMVQVVNGSQFTTSGSVAVNTAGGSGNAGILVSGTGSQFVQSGAVDLTVGSGTANSVTAVVQVSSGGQASTGTGTTTVAKTGMIDFQLGGRFVQNGDLVVDGGQFLAGSSQWDMTGQGRSITVKNGGLIDRTGAPLVIKNGQIVLATNGGMLWTSRVEVGNGGTGTFVMDGANTEVRSNGSSAFDLTVGSNFGAGNATFGNFGQTTLGWTYVGGDSYTDGSGTLTVDSGARVGFNALSIGVGGWAGQASGTVIVQGQGSQLYQTSSSNQIMVGGKGYGSLIVGQGATFAASGTTIVGAKGALKIQGGSALLGSLWLDNGGKVQLDSGLLSYQGGLEISSSSTDTNSPALFGANLVLGSGQSVVNTLFTHVASDGQFTLGGGSLSTPALANDGVFAYTGGTLTVLNTLSNNAGAAMSIGSNAVLNLGKGQLQNYGELTLGGGTATITGTSAQYQLITNQGVIRGAGRIAYGVSNQAGGELRAENGNRLLLSGANNYNDGRITLSYGGSVEAPSGLRNNTGGTISGDGVLRTGQFTYSTSSGTPVVSGTGLYNSGKMNFSGNTQVYGDVWTEGDGNTRIIVSGGATLTFYDDVFMRRTIGGNGKPEIRAGSGSRVVYFGLVKGDLNLTGSGVHSIEGTYAPGFCPGYSNSTTTTLALESSGTFGFDLAGTVAMADETIDTTGRYSHWDVGHLLLNGGTVDVNLVPVVAPNTSGALFAPQVGDQFVLMTWSNLEGSPADVTMDLNDAALPSGLSWDVSWGGTTGGSLVLTVVPEPAVLSTMMLAMALPLMRRQRARMRA